MEGPKLIDQLRLAIRRRHYGRSTEKAYVQWCVQYIRFHGLRHPRDLSADDLKTWLNYLANDRQVAASTQNQALSALLFLYKNVLEIELPWLDGVDRPRRPARLPVVLTRAEALAILDQLQGTA
jgi:integrase